MASEQFPSATELRDKYADWLSWFSRHELIRMILDTTSDGDLSIWWGHRDKKDGRNPFKEDS